MAHSCPECHQVCHCGGDIDDMILDGTEEQMNCTHCPYDGDGLDEWDDDELDEEPEVKCRVCGCSQLNACVHPVHGNCGWAEEDLCTHCRDYPGESKRYNDIISQNDYKPL